MDPNQQPTQFPQPQPAPQQPAEQPVQPPMPVAPPPQVPTPTPQPQPQNPYAQPAQPPAAPQLPTAYTVSPEPAYDPNYLDSIAPAPPRAKFFSGSFGKIFFALIGLFVIAVSIIVAFSGKDNTADLQQVTVRLQNFSQIAKAAQPNIRSGNLSATNSSFEIWLTSNTAQAEDLLAKGGVKKSQYSKDMVASEKTLSDNLTQKFTDAQLNARLNSVYASTMASETQKIINMLNTMSKKSASKQIRDYAKTASTNLVQIQQQFDKFVDDGN